jgi:hypothetical protein
VTRTITTFATLGLVGAALLVGPVAAFTPQAHAATVHSRHQVRHAMPRYFNQAPIEQAPANEYTSAAQRYYSDPPGWHDPSGCGIRCF